MIDLTGIALAVVGLVATFITVKLMPWIKSKTTEQQMATLILVVDILVYAAEQMYGPGTGKEKLQYVCDQLLKRGFKVDLDAIEAAVRRMNEDGWDTYELIEEGEC